MAKKQFQTPRGTYDILPADAPLWWYARQVLREEAESLGFQRLELPIFEDQRLFERATGETTDIVSKEMFGVIRASKQAETDREDAPQQLVLRPEFTPGIIRSYLEQGMQGWPQPVKLYTDGPIFRYSRPQKGRYRQFHQMDYEIIGDASPAADVAVILLTWNIFRRLGLADDVIVDINSLGDIQCRPKMRKHLVDYLSQHLNKLAPEDIDRVRHNPFRVLDSKEPKTLAVIKSGPKLIDLLCDDCKQAFHQVLELLDELRIPYNLDPSLVRGLDYYNRTTFEVRRTDDETRQNALGGGGRYDGLVELLGGRPTPAVGAAPGMDRMIEYMKEKQGHVPEQKLADAFVVAIGEHALKVAMPLVERLKAKGIRSGMTMTKNGIKEQLGMANRLGVRFVVILGEREVREKEAILKDMDEGSQETITLQDIEYILEKKLA
jgi:histidyl-tRNA synthetase